VIKGMIRTILITNLCFYYIISFCAADCIFDFVIVVFVANCEFEYFVVFDKMINWCTFERKIGL
jgi:hypothetical protein